MYTAFNSLLIFTVPYLNVFHSVKYILYNIIARLHSLGNGGFALRWFAPNIFQYCTMRLLIWLQVYFLSRQCYTIFLRKNETSWVYVIGVVIIFIDIPVCGWSLFISWLLINILCIESDGIILEVWRQHLIITRNLLIFSPLGWHNYGVSPNWPMLWGIHKL